MKRGPKTKYDKQTAITAGWLARDGKTHEEIAEALGIAESTFHEWLKKYPELSEAIKNNKDVSDNRVVDSLYKRAIGYDYEKTEIEVHVIGEKEFKKKKVIQMHVPGEPTAMIFWLVNRQPDKWKRNPQFIDFEKAKGEINALFDQMKSTEGNVITTA